MNSVPARDWTAGSVYDNQLDSLEVGTFDAHPTPTSPPPPPTGTVSTIIV